MQTVLSYLPLIMIPFFMIVIFLFSHEIGFRIGKRQVQAAGKSKDSSKGTMVGALLGLLAFMLAFTFGFAGSRFETRMKIVIEEANALGTAYLRSGYLPEPNRAEIQRLLRAYVDLRVEAAKDLKIDYVLAKSDELQDKLWEQAVKVAENSPNSVMAGLFIQSLNEVLDIHTQRVKVVLHSHIPPVIWNILFLLAILSMGALGYLSGLSLERSIILNLILIIAFTSVIYLIADIDVPGKGEVRVSQEALIALQKKIAL